MIKIVEEYIQWCTVPAQLSEVTEIREVYNNELFQKMYIFVDKNPEKSKEVLQKLGENLKNMDVLKACATSHYCGAIIEANDDFSIGKYLVDLFEKVVNLSFELVERVQDTDQMDLVKEYDKYPEEVKAYRGCELLTLAIMAVCTKHKESRYYLREKKLYKKMQELVSDVDSMVYATFVHEACYDLKILVLAPEKKKGAWIKAHDIHNCFYLFTLLEAELYRKGIHEEFCISNYVFDEEMYNVAIGKSMPAKLHTIESHCSYFTGQAAGDVEKSSINKIIFGEMPPIYLGRIPVVVMKKDGTYYSRAWDSNFCFKYHDSLSPKVEILEKLSEKEVVEWIERLSTEE